MPYADLEKQRAFQRKWKRKQNERYRLEIVELLGKCCVDCGISDIRVLQIDHIEPVLRKVGDHLKSLQSGTNLIQALMTKKLELTKVALRCANCHMIKTFEDRVKYSSYKGD